MLHREIIKSTMKFNILTGKRGLDKRSEEAYKNILGSIVLKGISMIVSLLLVPLTIEYISAEKYGIWLTLSSIVGWLAFFDIGLSNGTKNKITESLAKDDAKAAREYVSTSYIIIGIIFLAVFAVFATINKWLNWSNIMAVDSSLNDELSEVMIIVVGLFCLTMVINVVNSVVSAVQKPALSSFITTVGHVLVLLAIAALVYLSNSCSEGSLKYLAYCLSGIPCVVTILFSVFFYRGKYSSLSPSLHFFKKNYISDVLSLGWKFFIIQVSLILVFQISNLVIIRETNSLSVTQYNIAYRYFMISHMIYNIVLTPFWAAFTDAYTKNDYTWMRVTYNKLSKCWLVLTILVLLMLVVSPLAYKIWIGNQVQIPMALSVFMAVFTMLNSRAGLYMTLINGTGKVCLQMLAYLVAGFISVPLMIVLARLFGLLGVVSVMVITVTILSFAGHLQLKRILSNTASGVWNK